MRVFRPLQPPGDFDARLVNILKNMNDYLSQVNAGFGKIQRGELPISGSGPGSLGVTDHGKLSGLVPTFTGTVMADPEDDHSQYPFIYGRTGGQLMIGDPKTTNVGTDVGWTLRAFNGDPTNVAGPAQLSVLDMAVVLTANNFLIASQGRSIGMVFSIGVDFVNMAHDGSYILRNSSNAGLTVDLLNATGGATVFGTRVKKAAGTNAAAHMSEWNDSTNAPMSFIRASDGAFVGPIVASGTDTHIDNIFKILDDIDQTKVLQFQLSGLTSPSTRLWTVPDWDGTPVVANPVGYTTGLIVVGQGGAAPIWSNQIIPASTISKGLTIQALAAHTAVLFDVITNPADSTVALRRTANAGGGEVLYLDLVTPTGKNSGAVVLWIDGQTAAQRAAGTNGFIEQYYSATDDAYYVLTFNRTTTRIQFRHQSATGNPRFTLDPTDGGRFGVNVDFPSALFDIAGLFTVAKTTGLISGSTMALTGNITAAAIDGSTRISASSGGVTLIGMSTDGITDFLDIVKNMQIRDTIGGGGATIGILTKTGKLRLGDGTAPTHRLELLAGTATVAPAKIDPGTNLTTPLAGCVENDGTDFFVTDGTGDRNRLAPRLLSRTVGIDATVNGSTTIYTVPAGRSAIITQAFVRTTTYTSGSFIFGIGGAVGGDAITVAAAGFTANNQIAPRVPTTLKSVQAAAQALTFVISATSCAAPTTVAVDLFGYLI